MALRRSLAARSRKGRLTSQGGDCDYALAVLWYPVVREVDLADTDPIAGLDQRVEQVEYEAPAARRRESLDVLEYHDVWANFGGKPTIRANKVAPRVVIASAPS